MLLDLWPWLGKPVVSMQIFVRVDVCRRSLGYCQFAYNGQMRRTVRQHHVYCCDPHVHGVAICTIFLQLLAVLRHVG